MIELHVEAAFQGPNVWAHAPVLVARVRFDPASEGLLGPACEDLRAQWTDWLPAAEPEGHEALGAARTIAMWALAALNEVRGCVTEAGARAAPDGAWLWVGFHHPAVTRMALGLACRALAGVIGTREGASSRASMKEPLQALWRECQLHHPDYQARILMAGARARGIPYLPFMSGSRYWQYGWGARSRVFMESGSNADGSLGGQWQRSKALSHAVFRSLGLPVPAHRLVKSAAELQAAADAVGWPCVVKPIDRGGGRGVTVGVRTAQALHAAFDQARTFSAEPVMVEAFVPGDDHRLMVVQGRMIAAIRREASSVVGDGQRTVRELVKALNAPRSSNMVKSRYLRPIALDGVLTSHLGALGMTLTSVPAQGQRVPLRSNANLSTGGVCIDVTTQVHPEVRRMAESVTAAFGLGTAGLDYMTTDITQAPGESGGCLIEINTVPGLDAAIAGGWTPEAIAAQVLGERPGTIPVHLLVLSEDGMVRALAELDGASGPEQGDWVLGQRAMVGGINLVRADDGPWAAVHMALRHPSLHRLLVVCSARNLLSNGVPVERLASTFLCGVQLPSEWLNVLKQCGGRVELLDDLQPGQIRQLQSGMLA
jgi:cyanophycin synthetase